MLLIAYTLPPSPTVDVPGCSVGSMLRGAQSQSQPEHTVLWQPKETAAICRLVSLRSHLPGIECVANKVVKTLTVSPNKLGLNGLYTPGTFVQPVRGRAKVYCHARIAGSGVSNIKSSSPSPPFLLYLLSGCSHLNSIYVADSPYPFRVVDQSTGRSWHSSGGGSR